MPGTATAHTQRPWFGAVTGIADAALLQHRPDNTVAILAFSFAGRCASFAGDHLFGPLSFIRKVFGSGNGLF
jgi:hypothetical protein